MGHYGDLYEARARKSLIKAYGPKLPDDPGWLPSRREYEYQYARANSLEHELDELKRAIRTLGRVLR